MKPLLLTSFILLLSGRCFSQSSLVQLHLKKNGAIKKRIDLGSSVIVVTKTHQVLNGPVINLKKDSICFNRATVAMNDIECIKIFRAKPKMRFNWEEFGYVSLGVGLTTAGLITAKWQKYPGALHTAAAIGYSPYFFRFLKSVSLKKRKFKMRKKYSLRIWDIR